MSAPIQVGTICRVERYLGPSHGWAVISWSDTITRLTPKRAYFKDGDWFALDDPKREVKPRYLDHRTVVVKMTAPTKETR